MAAKARAEIASRGANDDDSINGGGDGSVQHIATKINEAYNIGANADADTDASKTLINLTA